MSSTENDQSSATTQQGFIKRPFTLPSRVTQLSPVEQSSAFPSAPPPSNALSPTQQRSVAPPSNALLAPLRFAQHTLPTPSTAFRSTYAPDPATGSLGETSTLRHTLPSLPLGVPHPPAFQNSPVVTHPLSEPVTPTYPLVEPTISPKGTRALPSLGTTVLPVLKDTTTSLRQPVVIRGSGKKRPDEPQPPRKRRRWPVQLVVTVLVAVIVVLTLLTVVPIDNEGDHFNIFQSFSNLIQSNANNPSLVAQLAATATAVTHQDGYGGGGSLLGGSSGNHFAFGNCTFWADYRYHQLTGHWVPWVGNAYQWAYGARQAGWIVSSSPHVPSIIVLQPGVQGAGWLGHVAIVEKINPDGSVYTSDMNWYTNGGGWDRVSYYTFSPGNGVSFLWHP